MVAAVLRPLSCMEQLEEILKDFLVEAGETDVVWGMPGAVVNAGLADTVLPLNEIGAEILRVTKPRLHL